MIPMNDPGMKQALKLTEEAVEAQAAPYDENLLLRNALKQAVSVIRVWHAMPQKPGDDDAFDLYYNHSPEMKPIRDVLGKMPEDA